MPVLITCVLGVCEWKQQSYESVYAWISLCRTFPRSLVVDGERTEEEEATSDGGRGERTLEGKGGGRTDEDDNDEEEVEEEINVGVGRGGGKEPLLRGTLIARRERG